MKIKLILATVAAVFLISPAWAGLQVEPYAGYGTGTFTLDSSLGSNESDVDGVLLGFRLGYHKLGFFIGPDFMLQFSGDFDPSINDPNIPLDSSASRSADSQLGSIFLTAGYTFPVLPLGIYAGYGLFSGYSLDFSNGADANFEGTGGYKLGVGYVPGLAVIRFPLRINLEYLVHKFDKVNGIGTLGGNKADFPVITGSGGTIAQYNDADIRSILLTVSVPFHFFE